MSDLDLQRFSVRLDAAVADGTITGEQCRLAKAALEGCGMEGALEALRAATLAKAGPTPADGADAAPESPQGETGPLVSIAEDKADLRDALNRDLGSPEAVDLIRKIAAAYAAVADDGAPVA